MKRLATTLVLILVVCFGAKDARAQEPDAEQRALDWLVAAVAQDRAQEGADEKTQMVDCTPWGKRYCAKAALAFLLETRPDRERYQAELRRLETDLLGVFDPNFIFPQSTWLLGFLGLWLAEKGFRADDVSMHYEKLLTTLTASANSGGGWEHGKGLQLPFYPRTLVEATNWSLLAYGTGRRLGIRAEGNAVEASVSLLEQVQGESGAFPYGGTTYRKGYEAGRTAGTVAALAALGRQETPAFRRAASYLLRDPAAVPRGHASPSMHVLLGSLAFSVMGDGAWNRWDAEVLKGIRAYQREDGTFNILSTGATSGISVGMADRATDLYVTALCAAALAMPRSKLAAALRVDVPVPEKLKEPEPSYVETMWSAEVPVAARLAADKGRVFLFRADTGLQALRCKDGTVLFESAQDLPATLGKPLLLALTSTHAFTCVVGGGWGPQPTPATVVALKRDDGTIAWTRSLDSQPIALCLDAGHLYLRLQRGDLHVLSAEDGEEVRTTPAGKMPPINSGLAVSPTGDLASALQSTVVVGTDPGNPRWSKTLPAGGGAMAPAYGGLAWVGSRLIAARTDGALSAYAADDGAEAWSTAGRSGIASLTPLGPEGPLLVQDFESALRAVSVKNGRELWRFAPPRVRENPRPYPPFCREGLIAVQSPGDGLTFFLDSASGSVRHVLRTSATAQVAIDSWMIYVLDYGRLWAMRRPVAEVMAVADEMLAKGSTTMALGLLGRAAEVYPQHAPLHVRLGRLLYDAQAYDRAAEALAQAARLGGLDPEHAVYHGHCHIALGDRARAKEAYLAGIAQHPGSDAPIRGGLLHLAGGDLAKAEPYLREAVEAVPSSWTSRYYLGLSLVQQERFDEAAEILAAAWELEGATADVGLLLGWAEEKRGSDVAACLCYRRVLEADPGAQEAATRWDRLLRTREVLVTEVQPDYEALLELAPNDPLVRNNYAYRLRRDAVIKGMLLGRDAPVFRALLERSIEVYSEAARMSPEDPQIQSDTGLVYEFYPCVRDDEIAKRYFLRALELTDFTYRDSLSGMIRMYVRQEDWKALLHLTQRALDRFEDGALAIVPGGADGKPIAMNAHKTSVVVAAMRQAHAAAEVRLSGGSWLRPAPALQLTSAASYDGFELPSGWKAVEVPASAPQGEAVSLRYEFAEGTAQILDVRLKGVMTQQGKQSPYTGGRALRLSACRPINGQGAYDIAASIEVSQQGQTKRARREFEASVRPDGSTVPGTLRTVPEALEMGVDICRSFYTALPPLPSQPVRVGETWRVPYEAYTSNLSMIPFEKADIHTEAWQTLEGFEHVDGVRCARIKTTFLTAMKTNAFLLRPGGGSRGWMAVRGSSTLLLGEDGGIRCFEEEQDQEIGVSDALQPSTISARDRCTVSVKGRIAGRAESK